MTKSELAQLVLSKDELKGYDITLPQMFVDDCQNLLSIDPRPYFIWCYKDSIIGKPVNLAERFYLKYQHAEELIDAGNNLLTDAIERNECWDTDNVPPSERKQGNMFDDYRTLAIALDQIHYDKENSEYSLFREPINNG